MTERISSGIKELNQIMEGGFKKNSTNLIIGGPGSGKSIFAMQFLVDGITNNKENGIYISLEESRQKLIDNLSRFGWNLEKLEKENKLSVLFLRARDMKQQIHTAWDIMLDKIKESKAKRIIIDSASAYAMFFESGHERRDAIIRMIDFLEECNCTTVLTLEQQTDLDDNRFGPLEFIEYMTDSVISLYNIRKGNVRQRALEVKKIRGTNHIQKIIPLKITSKGLQIYPEETVF